MELAKNHTGGATDNKLVIILLYEEVEPTY